MEFKGTKGKWDFIDEVIFADDYFNTHIAVIPNSYDNEIRKANALLISKAPLLLEAIKNSIGTLKEEGLIQLSEDFENLYKECITL